MDGFWCLRCPKHHINLSDIIRSFTAMPLTPWWPKIELKIIPDVWRAIGLKFGRILMLKMSEQQYCSSNIIGSFLSAWRLKLDALHFIFYTLCLMLFSLSYMFYFLWFYLYAFLYTFWLMLFSLCFTLYTLHFMLYILYLTLDPFHSHTSNRIKIIFESYFIKSHYV